MTAIPDDKLYSNAERVKDKVVVITGAANGIGRETAIKFAEYGAKVVIGDRDIAGGERTVKEIQRAGGQAASLKCDVLIWEDQVAMFDLAISRFGAVDIVVPNAGVAEMGTFDDVTFENGRPVKPSLTTINVNLVGVVYTTHLALHYLKLNRADESSLKAVILIGSMASWAGVPHGSLYAASKHAVLGLMRSLYPGFTFQNFRIACIHPFFADTAIVPVTAKLFLAGVPLTPVSRIAGAIMYAATDPSPDSNGSAWLLTDDGPVFHVPREEFKLGVYGMIDARANSLIKGAQGVMYYARVTRDVGRILGKQLLVLGVGAAAAKLAWDNRGVLAGYLS